MSPEMTAKQADEEKALSSAEPNINEPLAAHPTGRHESPTQPSASFFSRLPNIPAPQLLETRGIQRVLPTETHPLTWRSYLQVFVLWVSINLAAVNITLGMLAPTVFGLGFLDASLCAVFGSALGSCAVAYVATWGPKSGCRTMVREGIVFFWLFVLR